MLKCDKCREETNDGVFVTSMEKTFRICEYCKHFLDTHPTVTVGDFMGATAKQWVMENMRKAARLRKKGESPWKTKAL